MAQSRFIAFHTVAEAHAVGTLAPTFAVVIAHGPFGVVLVYNRYRQVWELPGGLIDAGESARDSASRELAEEAECVAGSLAWLGIVEADDGLRRCGAVFTCSVAAVPVHVSNAEVDGIAAWTPAATPAPLGPCDRALLERLARAGPPKSG